MGIYGTQETGIYTETGIYSEGDSVGTIREAGCGANGGTSPVTPLAVFHRSGTPERFAFRQSSHVFRRREDALGEAPCFSFLGWVGYIVPLGTPVPTTWEGPCTPIEFS